MKKFFVIPILFGIDVSILTKIIVKIIFSELNCNDFFPYFIVQFIIYTLN